MMAGLTNAGAGRATVGWYVATLLGGAGGGGRMLGISRVAGRCLVAIRIENVNHIGELGGRCDWERT